MSGTKIIVGLGNPGREYKKTRHNLGFMAVEVLAAEYGATFTKCRYANALSAEARVADTKIILVLPQTYMNNSGMAVGAVVNFDKVALEDLMVVVDDLHLDFGQIRLRLEGSDAGHNGLKSIMAHLNTIAFARLRLGIGSAPSVERQADHVLAEFSRTEEKDLESFIQEAVRCLKLWISGETAEAMTRYNKRKDNG
jgi:peptidyl-tRNA hydrolase, PTH1 family